MAEEIDKIEELSAKLDQLLSMHNAVSTEIDSLRVEIIRLKVQHKQKSASEPMAPHTAPPSAHQTNLADDNASNDDPANPESTSSGNNLEDHTVEINTTNDDIPLGEQDTDYFEKRHKRTIAQEIQDKPKNKFDIEKLIGENLINKIGILIVIIGVAIGAKYSIENELISPLGRILFGYGVGVILLGIGMWLKKKYLNFSAVLVSGAMAIFYFITFFAFNFYQLIGQEIAFGLMVIFTIFTVIASLNYDKQIIAHLGLVGAVSVPFLLSNDSGNAVFLFSYLALINLGIAFISLKKNWKFLFYSAFALTWLIYFVWMVMGYKESQHFTLALSFLTLYFILFYVIFIAYKFLNLKKYNVGDVIILLLNALIFFTLGYFILDEHEIGGQVLGAFAVVNAFIHFIAATIIHKRKLADRNLFYLIIGLVLVCLTIAIPIQLDGYWVTIMWSAEAVVLFLIGRSKQVAFYEYISFALLTIAAMSLIQDWEVGYHSIASVKGYPESIKNSDFPMFFNTLFLSSFIAAICLGVINWFQLKLSWRQQSKISSNLMQVLDYILPIALIVVVYCALRLEIMHYFSLQFAEDIVVPDAENDSYFSRIFNAEIEHKSIVWLHNYTLLFFGLLSIIIYRMVKSIKATWALIAVNMLVILAFLVEGLYELSELRENYLNQYQAEYFNVSNSFIWLRYVSLGLLAMVVTCTYFLLKKVNRNGNIYAVAETIFYLIILWVSTSELIQWLDYAQKNETYGLVLSIFWGIFSVIIIAFGIWKKKKHLRILGIAIFAVTLVKLFFYDLSYLTAIAKTIVMISLGALLLLTSFLYNKYTIEDESED